MKSMTMLGILLAVLGVLALVYQGFNYTHQKKGSRSRSYATPPRMDTEHVSLPPIIGLIALAGGIVLLVMVRNKRRSKCGGSRLTLSFIEEGARMKPFAAKIGTKSPIPN